MLGAATVVVDDRHRVPLVKHAYGERNWELPGGRGQAGEIRGGDRASITVIGWFLRDTLSASGKRFHDQADRRRVRRAAVTVIGARVWLR